MPSSPDNPNATSMLAGFVCRTTPHDVPEAIRGKAMRHILDTLACGLAGTTSQEAKACLDLMEATQETGPAAIWGTSGAEFVLAVILGYDVARRVLEACGGYGPHNDAGWHSTATCGTFGAAVAAARLLGLDLQATTHAIGHAASFSGGLWAFIHDGSQTKRIHAGRAAEGGLLAALLARSGITGASAIFEDKWGGFLSTFAPGSSVPSALTAGLGDRWGMERVSLKPYASCRGTHSAIDALGDLLAENTLEVDDIGRIEVRLSGFLHGMCGTRNIATLAQSQMSLPYALPARLRLGRADLEAYSDDQRMDPALQTAMDNVVLIGDESIPSMDEPFVRIVATDSRTFERRVTVPLGSPANPMPDAAYFTKVRKLMRITLAEEQVEHLITNVLDLWRDPDMRWLSGALKRPARIAN